MQDPLPSSEMCLSFFYPIGICVGVGAQIWLATFDKGMMALTFLNNRKISRRQKFHNTQNFFKIQLLILINKI